MSGSRRNHLTQINHHHTLHLTYYMASPSPHKQFTFISFLPLHIQPSSFLPQNHHHFLLFSSFFSQKNSSSPLPLCIKRSSYIKDQKKTPPLKVSGHDFLLTVLVVLKLEELKSHKVLTYLEAWRKCRCPRTCVMLSLFS